MKITNGEYVINSQDHGLDANNSVRIAKGSINITSGSDGIHSEEEEEGLGFVYIENGDLEINSVNDGISSYTYTEIVDGNFTITTDSGSVETAASQGFGPGGVITDTSSFTPPLGTSVGVWIFFLCFSKQIINTSPENLQ